MFVFFAFFCENEERKKNSLSLSENSCRRSLRLLASPCRRPAVSSLLRRIQKRVRRHHLGAGCRRDRHDRGPAADDEPERPRLVGDCEKVLGAALELDGLVEDEVEELVVALEDALDCVVVFFLFLFLL